MGKVAIALLHGYNSTPLFMKGVEYEFSNWGKLDYVYNLSMYGLKWGLLPSKYNNSTPILRVEGDKVSLESTILENVLDQLTKNLDNDIDELILLGHSMGGLVWRALYKAVIHNNSENWLGRPSPRVIGIIQLATPNQGSKLTNMRLIKFFDKIHSSVILKIAGYSVKLLNKLSNILGIFDRFDPSNYEEDEQTTQLKQMKPGSNFLQWLNSPPTYVDVIPHFRAIGTKNSVFFTNLAWMDHDDEVSTDVIINNILERQENIDSEDLEEVMGQIDVSKIKGDVDIRELRDFLEYQVSSDDRNRDIPLTDQIKALFDNTDFEPNDGLVSIQDAELPGSILIDLDEYGKNLSHYSIIMWFLPFDTYRYVRDQVFAIIESNLLN